MSQRLASQNASRGRFGLRADEACTESSSESIGLGKLSTAPRECPKLASRFACYEDHMAELQEAVMFCPSVLSGVFMSNARAFLARFLR